MNVVFVDAENLFVFVDAENLFVFVDAENYFVLLFYKVLLSCSSL